MDISTVTIASSIEQTNAIDVLTFIVLAITLYYVIKYTNVIGNRYETIFSTGKNGFKVESIKKLDT